MARIEVVRATELMSGISTIGIARDRAFESEDLVVSRSRIAAGATSAWHHHGDRHLYGFLASGRLRLEYGPDGSVAADLRWGDFFHIPPGLVHRDVNPTKRESVVVNVLAGTGTLVINVDGPTGS